MKDRQIFDESFMSQSNMQPYMFKVHDHMHHISYMIGDDLKRTCLVT